MTDYTPPPEPPAHLDDEHAAYLSPGYIASRIQPLRDLTDLVYTWLETTGGHGGPAHVSISDLNLFDLDPNDWQHFTDIYEPSDQADYLDLCEAWNACTDEDDRAIACAIAWMRLDNHRADGTRHGHTDPAAVCTYTRTQIYRYNPDTWDNTEWWTQP